MAKLKDTKIPITDFLDLYRQQPCLYNSMMHSYKNRSAREDAYYAIVRSLKLPHLTSTDIKLKIKSIRTVYTKELRTLMREKEEGRSYEPKLFWFKQADSFLRSVSLSHLKKFNSKSGGSSKKDADAKMLLSYSTEISDETRQDHDVELDAESAECLHEAYANSDDHKSDNACNIATNTNLAASAIGQTMEEPQNNLSRTELLIDDSSMSTTLDQQQTQQTQQQQQHHQTQRKLNYLPYAGHQQAQQRLCTPFTSPSPQLDATGSGSAATTLCHIANGGNDDDLLVFGQSVASQLRSIPDAYARSVAKLRIQQVLFEAETGQSSQNISPHMHNF